mmetsp:Transcript_94945/g.245197  ORF Transcript_94945/g.245197 Transcript_94945/m.245197 type:complete len:223 (-) Transcript_94945:2152-2820(-)
MREGTIDAPTRNPVRKKSICRCGGRLLTSCAHSRLAGGGPTERRGLPAEGYYGHQAAHVPSQRSVWKTRGPACDFHLAGLGEGSQPKPAAWQKGMATQKTVPSRRMRIGDEPSARLALAASRPACQVPASRTAPRGSSFSDNPSLLRRSAASLSMSTTVSARHSTTSSVPTFTSCSSQEGSFNLSTPVSTSKPALRYSARAVSASVCVTSRPSVAPKASMIE